MIGADFDTFVGEFTRLAAALDPYRRSPQAIASKADAYFHALKAIPLADVIAKADAWLAHESKFPKPVEWASVIVQKHVDLPEMTYAQAKDYRRAELQGYEDNPCSCALCIQAGVTERPLRFVPEFTPQDLDRKIRDPLQNRVVTAGHWAHGAELARWYEARGAFWNRCAELGLLTKAEVKTADKVPIEKRLEQIFSHRASPNGMR